MSGLPGMREYSQNENTSKWDDDSDCTDSSSEAGSQQEDCEVVSAPRAAAAAPAPAGLWRAPPAAGGDASDQQLAAGRSAGVGASARPRGAAAAVGPLATTAVPSASLAQGAAASRLPTAAERRAECRCLDYFWCCQKDILPAVAPQTGQNIRNVAPPAHGFCAWAHHRNIANPILVSMSQYNTLSGWSSRSLLSSAELSYTKYMTAHGTKCTAATAVY